MTDLTICLSKTVTLGFLR